MFESTWDILFPYYLSSVSTALRLAFTLNREPGIDNGVLRDGFKF